MRVLQLCDTYPPEGGGLGAHVERLGSRLVARGHEVTVVTAGERAAVEERSGLAVRRLPLSLARLPGAHEPTSPPFHPPWADRRFRRGLEEAIAAFGPDLIHAHGWCVHSALAAAGPPVVATLHDYNLSCPKKSLLRRGAICAPGRGPACLDCDEQNLPKRAGLAAALALGTPRLRRRVRRLFAVSGYVAARAREAGIPARLIEVVPNFVDLPDAPAPASAATANPYLLYAGPSAPHKGRAVLLEAFAGLEREVGLRLAGGDGSCDAPGVEDLGYRSGAALETLFREALAVVVPSVWADPCPTVALEAMAQGRPVVASDSGGLSEIVADGETGLLVPAGDVAALRAALARLLDDPELRERMGARGRERVRRFSAATVLPTLEALYAGAGAR